MSPLDIGRTQPEGKPALKLFRPRIRQQATVGVYMTRDVMAVATVDHEHGRKPRVIGLDCHPLSENVDSGRLLHDSIASTHMPVNLVLDNSHYELLLVEAPRVEPSELRAAVRWKIKNLIDFHVDDAIIDVFEIPGQENRPQGQSMMYVVAARSRRIREYVDLFEENALNLQVIDIADMALRNLASLLEDDIRGVALLCLDGPQGVITLTRQGNLYLTRRLESTVESTADYQPDAHQQIVLEVQRSLDYYDSHFSQPPITALHVLPGDEDQNGLVSALAEGLDIGVSTFDVHSVLDFSVELPPQHRSAALIAVGGTLRREEVSL
jgi:MSHA biogenesis protein MshI